MPAVKFFVRLDLEQIVEGTNGCPSISGSGWTLTRVQIGDVLVVGKGLDKEESRQRKSELDRMAAMISRLGGRGYCVKEELEYYASTKFDSDSDNI